MQPLGSWLMLLPMLLASVSVAASDKVCSPVNTTEDVQLPLIPKSYQASIEMNIVTKNETYEIEEWLDGDLGNMKIRMYQKNGVIEDFIFNNATREIYVIYNNIECLVINMTDSGDLGLLFGNDGRVVASAKNILRFSKEFGMEYRNRTMIRNTLVDYWYSCQNWPERQAQFELHWYFSASSWNTPFFRNLPVRAEVKGLAGDISNQHEFHIVYDFISFRETLMVSEKIFDTPSGVYCANRRQVQKPPQMPEVMSYSQELLVYDPVLERVQYGNVYYDASQFLVKYQFRDPFGPVTPPFYNQGSMTVVQDFTTGVSYFIDDVRGNCSDKPIGAEFFDVEDLAIKDKPGWYLIELRSPMHLFRIDNTYQYTGKRLSRGIPIDRYISLRSDYPIKGREDMNFTFEYEMLDPKVAEVVIGKNKLNVGSNIPVQLRISNFRKIDLIDPTFDYREVYNFYNFDTKLAKDPTQDFDRIQAYDLDITACYTKREQKNILIRFLNFGLYAEVVKNEPNLFVRRAAQVLKNAEFGMVNPLRFQKVRLDYDEEFIYLIVTLLDGPHPYAQFTRLKGENRYVGSAEATVNVNSELECLQKCNENRRPACNSIAYCPGSKTGSNCLMSSSFKRDTPNPDPTHQCSVLMRPVSVLRPDSTELSLESAFTLLVNYVETGLFRVPMEASKPDEHGQTVIVNFTAVSIEQFEIRPNVDLALTGRHLFKFTAIRNSGLRPQFTVKEAVSVDDCAELCLGRADFACKSFTYCYDMGQCYLHDVSPYLNGSNVVPRARCNLYDENALGSFEKEVGISRNHAESQEFQLVSGEEECATICLSDEACRSFDLCNLGDKLMKLCYTSASHKTDSVNQTNININCTHYSRSFTTDFRQDYKLNNPDLSVLRATIADVNLDLCSRRCVEQYGERCNGFFYCQPDGTTKSSCTIHQPGEVKVKTAGTGTPSCSYYSRQYDTDGRVWVTRSPEVVPDGFIGVSGLNVSLVALVLLLVFALAGIGIVLGLLHYRSRASSRPEQPAVRFTRDSH